MQKSAKQLEDEMIVKAVCWAVKASNEIYRAGGTSDTVISMFDEKLLATLVRNNLNLQYLGIL